MTAGATSARGLALVTGASGFVGRHVVSQLRSSGDEVRACVLPGEDATFLAGLGAEVVRADLTRPQALPALFAGGIDRVFHVGAICNLSTPYAKLARVNVDGVASITGLALDAGVRCFVHISSTSVYGRSRGVPFTEDSPQLPADDYGLSKRDGEDIVWKRIAEGLPAVILRPCTVYGPGCTDGAGKAFSRPTSIPAIPGNGRARLSNVRVEDVAAAAIFVSRREDLVGRVFNIADDTHPSIEEALVLAAETFGTKRPRVHVPLLVLSALARLQGAFAASAGRIPDLESDAVHYLHDDYIVDNARLRAAGFQLRHPDFEDSMRELGRLGPSPTVAAIRGEETAA